MAFEGDLKDVGLGNIIQIICLERRKGRLILRREAEAGTIYFNNGEIVHASLGELQGTEAVYKLLTWQNGWFRMSEQAEIPFKTIKVNWNRLLLEGMKKIDDGERQGKITEGLPPLLSQAQLERDQHLENQFINLLSKLEHLMAHLKGKKVSKKPQEALSLLAQLVNATFALSEVSIRSGRKRCSLKDLHTNVTEQYPQAKILHTDGNRLDVKTAENLFKSWAGGPAERRFFFRRIAMGIRAILDISIKQLIQQFHCANKQQEWGEAAAVFLTDLQNQIEHVVF